MDKSAWYAPRAIDPPRALARSKKKRRTRCVRADPPRDLPSHHGASSLPEEVVVPQEARVLVVAPDPVDERAPEHHHDAGGQHERSSGG